MNRPLKRELVFQLVDTARLLRTHIDQHAGVAARPGRNGAFWRGLRRGDGQTRVALADSMEMQPISLGRLIDKLEMQAFVERRRSEGPPGLPPAPHPPAGRNFVNGLDALQRGHHRRSGRRGGTRRRSRRRSRCSPASASVSIKRRAETSENTAELTRRSTPSDALPTA